MSGVWIDGSKNFKRGGDSCFKTGANGRTLSATLNMEVSDILATGNASYRVQVGFVGKTFSGSFNATLHNMRIRVGLIADMMNKKLSLAEYEVETMTGFDIKVNVKGFFGWFNWFINKFLPKARIANAVKDAIKNQLVNQIKNFTAWDKIPIG